MGGLTVHMSFDDYNSDRKRNWQLREDITSRTPLWAQIIDANNIEPGEYTRSGIIYIDYD